MIKVHKSRMLLWTLIILGLFFFFESEKALTNIVERYEKTHTCKHSDVFLDGNRRATEQISNERLCDAVGDSVAYGNVCYKAEYYAPITLFVSEGIVLIQKVAQYTAEKVVGGRGKPITEMKAVIKHKHYCGTEQSVYAAYQYEFPECFVKKLLYHNNHLFYLNVYYNTGTRNCKHAYSAKKLDFQDVIAFIK